MTLKRLAIAVAILAAAAVFLATYSGWSDAALHAFKPKTVRPKAPAGSPEAFRYWPAVSMPNSSFVAMGRLL
ncbi:MAG: hypothetical protein U0V87_16205 [Acidobacteriota bacterium]